MIEPENLDPVPEDRHVWDSDPYATTSLVAKWFHQMPALPIQGPKAETAFTPSAQLVDELFAHLGWLRAGFDERWQALCNDGVQP